MNTQTQKIVGSDTVANTAKHSYESKVLLEALDRAGGNPNIKGIIHEVMVKDLFNGNPVRLVDGKTAQLVNSNTAKAVDMVVMKGGKVLERIQLKDTPKSIVDTVRKVSSGQYNSVQLWGTTETTEAFNQAAKTSKNMTSTGVSSKTTEALAKRIGKEGSNGSVSLASSVETMAKNGAVWGGAISGGIAAVYALDDYFDGTKDGVEVVTHIAKESAGGALSGAAAGAAATTVGTVLAASVGTTTVMTTVLTVGAPVLVAVAVGAGVKYLWDSIFD
jgi:hypothetical protein